jgi:hypothetical protein
MGLALDARVPGVQDLAGARFAADKDEATVLPGSRVEARKGFLALEQFGHPSILRDLSA